VSPAALVRWCVPTRTDVYSLPTFVCTDPPKKTWVKTLKRQMHPREWELAAQARIRTAPVPWPPRSMVLLGKVDDVVVAAAVFGVERDLDDADRANGYVEALCVAYDHQSQGIGPALLDEVVAAMKDQTLKMGRHVLVVQGFVHKRNDPSRKVLERSGWSAQDLGEGSGSGNAVKDYDTWATNVDMA
jgi:GNAT superfamily N-acetyltransferase